MSVEIWLARHGETEWTISRRHTSRTDLELTPHGEEQARALREAMADREFALVASSPLLRARRTAELAGFVEPVLDEDLREWDYGEYEGVTTAAIRDGRPGWDLWRDGCPGGESPAEVGERADRALERMRAAGGDVLAFGHGHMTRVVAARYLGLEPDAGRMLMLSPASLSVLGHEHESPALARWNVPAQA